MSQGVLSVGMKFNHGDIVQVKGAYPCIGIICGYKIYEFLGFIIYNVEIIKSSLFEIGEMCRIAEEFLMEYNCEV